MPPNPSNAPARRTVVVAERLPPEVARALGAVGLELRTSGDPAGAEILLVDPRALRGEETGLEQVVASRVAAILSRVGDQVPALHGAVMGQAERGLFKAVLAHTAGHLGRAAKILGLDRNTCARKARAFGLFDEPQRGRKPRKTKCAARRPARRPRARSR